MVKTYVITVRDLVRNNPKLKQALEDANVSVREDYEDYKARTRLLDQWLLEERVEDHVSVKRVRSIDNYRDELAGEMAAYPIYPITFADEVDDDRNIADYADA